jgi:hypothetical protein
MADFLSPPPDRITISGTGVVNPDYEIVTIRPGDFFTGQMVISSAFALSLPDTVTIKAGISGTHISEDSRPDKFQETVRSGRIDAVIENHLPLGTVILIFMGTRGDSLLYTDPSTRVLGPYYLSSAVTDESGHVVIPVSSSISDSLDSEELSILDNDSIYFGQKLGLLPTDTAGVLITGSDYFGVKATARIELRIGDNF